MDCPGGFRIVPPGLSYYNEPEPERRSETTSRESRYNRDYEGAEVIHQEFLAEDSVSSIIDIEEKLKKEQNLTEACQCSTVLPWVK